MQKLLLLFFLCGIICANAQLKPMTLSLKNGEELKVFGKIKSNGYLKYKTAESSKSQKVHLSKIEFLKMKNAIDEEKVFRYMSVENKKNGVLVEEMILGNSVSLYAVIENGFINQAGMVTPITSIDYYIKRNDVKKLTRLGEYDPLLNNLKEKVIFFFNDCKVLISKIKDKEFKVESDMQKIVNFYNNNCN